MASPSYVWEQMFVAIDTLCDEGTFIERLENATVSALIKLNDNDLDGELRNDLDYILGWTKNNIEKGVIQRQPNELERAELIKKMLHILLETDRIEYSGE